MSAIDFYSGGGGAGTWASVLASGNVSGGTNPTITSGDSIRGANGATGGALPLVGGTGSAGAGGAVTITGGTATGAGNQGGSLTFTGGAGNDGVGGNASLIGGNGAGTNRAGGFARVSGGDGIGTAAGGVVSIFAGGGGGTGVGGALALTGGQGGSTSGNGGDSVLQGGSAAGGGFGGDAYVIGGAAAGNNQGGTVFITGGSAPAGDGGDVEIAGSSAGGASGLGGRVNIIAGRSDGATSGGTISITGGEGGATGAGGALTFRGGAGGATSGSAGAISILGGTPVDGAGGAVSITGSAAIGTNRAGGTASLTAGNATGNAAGGIVNITSGSSPTGTAGYVRVLTATTGAAVECARFESAGTLTLGDGTGTSLSSPGFSAYSLLAYRNSANFWANYAFSDTATDSTVIDSIRARGTVSARASVADGDTIALHRFVGFRGPSATGIAATITSKAVGPFIVGVGGTLEFATTPSSGTVPLDRWFITAAGNFEKQTQGNYILTERSVTARTADLALTHSNSFGVYTNEGAAGTVNFTLPTAAAGMEYEFYVLAAQTLQITAAAGDTIRIGANVTATAGNVTNNVIGGYLKIIALNATEWASAAPVGTWTVT